MPDEPATAADAVEQTNGGETPQVTDASATRTQEQVGNGRMSPERISEILRASAVDEDSEPDGTELMEVQSAPDPLEDFLEELPDETEDEPEQSEEETVETDEETTEEQPTDEEQEDKTETATEAPKSDGRQRLNINWKKNGEFVYSDRERAIMSLAAEKGTTLSEAERTLFGDKQAIEAKTEKSDEVTGPVKSLAELQAEREALEKESTTAEDNLDLKAFAKVAKQIREIEKQMDQVQAAEVAKTATRAQLEKVSLELTLKLYPDANDQSTALGVAVAKEIARLEGQNSPIFNDPEWSEAITAKVAARLGIAPVITDGTAKAPDAKPAIKPAVKTQPARKRVLPSPAQGSVSAPTTRSPAQISEEIQRLRKSRDDKGLSKLIASLGEA